MIKQKGFTVVELLVVILVLGVGSWLFFSEKARVTAVQDDMKRKTSINAMYYSLEEVFYPKNGYYPTTIDSKTLRSVDPELFADPSGIKIGAGLSDFRYEATGCSIDGKCQHYTLRSEMQREGDYIKTDRPHK